MLFKLFNKVLGKLGGSMEDRPVGNSFCYFIFGVCVVSAMFFGAVFGLVRFVKWAWLLTL